MKTNFSAASAGRALRILPLLFGLAAMYSLIFSLSAQDGETSGSLSAKVVALFIPESAPYFGTAVTVARKLAHAAEYALLYLLWYPALRLLLPKLSRQKVLFCALFIAVLSAAGDETHQLYVPGRAGLVTDVLIDTAGALAAMGVTALVSRALRVRAEGRH